MKRTKLSHVGAIGMGGLSGFLVGAADIPGVDASPPTAQTASGPSFALEIDGVPVGNVTGIDGLGIENEIIEYQDGPDLILRKRFGRRKINDVTITKAYIKDDVLLTWLTNTSVQNGEDAPPLSIILNDNTGEEVQRWTLEHIRLRSHKLKSLDGKGNDVLVEEIVIVAEELRVGA